MKAADLYAMINITRNSAALGKFLNAIKFDTGPKEDLNKRLRLDPESLHSQPRLKRRLLKIYHDSLKYLEGYQ
jgi:hypothetical protein